MISLFIRGENGAETPLPAVVSATVEQTLGSPCDALGTAIIYTKEAQSLLERSREIVARQEGTPVFTGTVDECETALTADGLTLSLSARGRAALLLDREVEGAQFTTAQLEDILKLYVRPAGITDIDAASIPPLGGYTVESGSTAFKALSEFCALAAGIRPRFDGAGRLVLRPAGEGGRKHVIDSGSACVSAVRTVKRYGVLSEVEVVERTTGKHASVSDESLKTLGIIAKEVITAPSGRLSYFLKKAALMLSESKQGRINVRLALKSPFALAPGDLASLSLPGITGDFLVKTARTSLSQNGAQTDATLCLI